MWKRSLEAVLRIRALLEDLARAELETRTQAVRRLESAADQESAGALDSRNQALMRLMDDRDRNAWLVDLADAEIQDWKSRDLRAQAETQKPAAALARGALLDRRRERRQMESLLAAGELAEERERLRREQRQADDWFQQRRGTADSGIAPTPTRKGQ